MQLQEGCCADTPQHPSAPILYLPPSFTVHFHLIPGFEISPCTLFPCTRWKKGAARTRWRAKRNAGPAILYAPRSYPAYSQIPNRNPYPHTIPLLHLRVGGKVSRCKVMGRKLGCVVKVGAGFRVSDTMAREKERWARDRVRPEILPRIQPNPNLKSYPSNTQILPLKHFRVGGKGSGCKVMGRNLGCKVMGRNFGQNLGSGSGQDLGFLTRWRARWNAGPAIWHDPKFNPACSQIPTRNPTPHTAKSQPEILPLTLYPSYTFGLLLRVQGVKLRVEIWGLGSGFMV